ncbi:hypothetical protein LCGC14_2473180 [marine sediment metagenome]|uniref:Uncharacterized protein n=1 Tax=marine sediment metagenome TaxID=412755 RepID=A0A0F9BXM5_9ZZZZ
MANGEQLERAINEAKAEVARHGYASNNLTDRAVMLAGFGFLADKLERQSVRIRLDGKKTMAGMALAVAGLVAGVLQGLF